MIGERRKATNRANAHSKEIERQFQTGGKESLWKRKKKRP
jgi:hypothetical protein